MYCALVAYIVFEGPEEERNMNTLVEMINSMEVREDAGNGAASAKLNYTNAAFIYKIGP